LISEEIGSKLQAVGVEYLIIETAEKEVHKAAAEDINRVVSFFTDNFTLTVILFSWMTLSG
jgi:hypothetical protein